MTRKERQEARAERFRQYAENAEKRATAAFIESNEAVAGIVPGQPILVGHHSEKAHRRAVERAGNAMDRCVRESEKAEYYRRKAEAVENNDKIYIGDDDAAERLEAKIADLTKKQELMKSVNKLMRSKKNREDKIAGLLTLGFSQEKSEWAVKTGFIFMPYELTNNNAKINAAKARLKKVRKFASVDDKEYKIGDITIEECFSENRLRIYFPGKPDEETRTKLKKYGYRWSPRNECWQAYINNWAYHYISELKSNQ